MLVRSTFQKMTTNLNELYRDQRGYSVHVHSHVA